MCGVKDGTPRRATVLRERCTHDGGDPEAPPDGRKVPVRTVLVRLPRQPRGYPHRAEATLPQYSGQHQPGLQDTVEAGPRKVGPRHYCGVPGGRASQNRNDDFVMHAGSNNNNLSILFCTFMFFCYLFGGCDVFMFVACVLFSLLFNCILFSSHL